MALVIVVVAAAAVVVVVVVVVAVVMIMNSVNIVCCDDISTHVQGTTCLHYAARWGRTDIAKYLLDNTRLHEQVDILDKVS